MLRIPEKSIEIFPALAWSHLRKRQAQRGLFSGTLVAFLLAKSWRITALSIGSIFKCSMWEGLLVYLLKHSSRKSLPAAERFSGNGGGPFDDAMWNMADI